MNEISPRGLGSYGQCCIKKIQYMYNQKNIHKRQS